MKFACPSFHDLRGKIPIYPLLIRPGDAKIDREKLRETIVLVEVENRFVINVERGTAEYSLLCVRANLECIFEAEELPCEFCQSRGIREPCIKRWGPKKEMSVYPSRSISRYDGTIPLEDVQTLQFTYYHGMSWNDLQTHLSELIRKLSFHFQPSIVHAGFRHSVLACCYREKYKDSEPTDTERQHMVRAVQGLRRALEDKNSVNGGDMFTSFFLTLWLTRTREIEQFELSSYAIVELMKLLSERRQSSPALETFSAYWPIVRDQIMTIAEFRVLQRKLSFEILIQLYKRFREVVGPKTVQQVQSSFEGQLGGAKYDGSTISRLRRSTSLTSVRLITSLQLLCAQPFSVWANQDSDHYAYVEAFLVDCYQDVRGFNEKEQLYPELLRYYESVSKSDTSSDARLIRLFSLYKAISIHRLRPLTIITLGKATAQPEFYSFCKDMEDNLGSLSKRLGEVILASPMSNPEISKTLVVVLRHMLTSDLWHQLRGLILTFSCSLKDILALISPDLTQHHETRSCLDQIVNEALTYGPNEFAGADKWSLRLLWNVLRFDRFNSVLY